MCLAVLGRGRRAEGGSGAWNCGSQSPSSRAHMRAALRRGLKCPGPQASCLKSSLGRPQPQPILIQVDPEDSCLSSIWGLRYRDGVFLPPSVHLPEL